MKLFRFAAVTLSGAFVLAFSGCSKSESHEKVAEDAVHQLERVGTAIGEVKDKTTAEKAGAKLKEIAAEIKSLTARAKTLGVPSEEERAKIKAQLEAKRAELLKAMAEMQKGIMAAGPEGQRMLMEGMMQIGAGMEELRKNIVGGQ